MNDELTERRWDRLERLTPWRDMTPEDRLILSAYNLVTEFRAEGLERLDEDVVKMMVDRLAESVKPFLPAPQAEAISLFDDPAPAAPEAPTGPVLGVCDTFPSLPHKREDECAHWRPVAPEGSAT